MDTVLRRPDPTRMSGWAEPTPMRTCSLRLRVERDLECHQGARAPDGDWNGDA